MVHQRKRKIIATPSSYPGSPTNQSALPSPPVLGPGNTGDPSLNAGSIWDMLLIPKRRTKAPKGESQVEGGVVGYLWNNNNNKKTPLKRVFSPQKEVPSRQRLWWAPATGAFPV